jgi:hypothetical protein
MKNVLGKVLDVAKVVLVGVTKALYKASKWCVFNLFRVLPSDWKVALLEEFKNVK